MSFHEYLVHLSYVIYVGVRMDMCVCVYMYVHVHICMCVYICTCVVLRMGSMILCMLDKCSPLRNTLSPLGRWNDPMAALPKVSPTS